MVRCFLDIDIGDAAAYAEASAAHKRAADFLAAVGAPQLSLPASLVRRAVAGRPRAQPALCAYTLAPCPHASP